MKNLVSVFAFLLLCLPAFAVRTYVPNTSTSILPATNTYCQGATASNVTFTYATCNSGTGAASGISLSIQWYSNTVNSNSGGTAVGSPVAGTSATGASGTVTLTPSTATLGIRYYYCVLTWTGTGTCNTSGTLTSGTTQVTINAIPVISTSIGSAAICRGATTTLGASGGTTYTWSPATGLSASTGATVTFSGTATATYTVTGTTSGCSSTATRAVTVNVLPTITTSGGATAICRGSSTTLGASGGSTYTWAPGATLSVTTGTPVTAIPTVTTTYTVTGTNATTGCSATATRVLTVNTPPTIATTAGSSTICRGATTTMTATGGNTYVWTPATGLSTSTGATVTFSGTNTTTYTVTGTNTTTGCVNTATRTITVNDVPVITTTAGPTTVCRGTTTTIAASGGTTYTWTPATGLSATTGATVTFSGTTTTTYTVTGTTSGCSATATRAISVNALPTITASGGAATICNGASTTLSASGGNTYSWLPATGLTVTTGTPVTANPTTTTTYTVTGTNTTTGCSNIATRLITVNAIPVIATAVGSAAVCRGATTTITASGATTYTWTPATGLSATAGATVTFSGTTTATYTITGITSGCSGTGTRTITVNTLPVISATSGSAAICRGSSTTLSASGGSTYAWAPSATLSASTGTPVTATPTVTTTYTVTGTSATTGCSATATRVITVNALPTITTTVGTATLCSGNSTTIAAGGGTSYVWSPATSLSATTGTTVTCNTTSTRTYTVTGTNANGCVNTATRAITVPFTSVAAGATAVCNGSATTMTASGSTTYTWSPSTGLSATTGATVTATVTTTRTYTVTGTSSGCVTTGTRTITMNALPVITASGGATTLCSGSSTTMAASGGLSYTWSPSTGLSATTGTPVTVTPAATATYSVFGVNANGCVGTATRALTVNALPTIATAVGSAAICIGASTTITASGGTSYVWTPSTGLSATTGATVTASPTVTTVYTVTGTNANGCVNTTTRTITVNILPTVSTTAGATVVCRGSSTTITASGASTYSWTPATGLSATTGATVTFTGTTTTTYTVTGTSTVGCTNTATRAITVNALPAIVAGGSTSLCRGSSATLTASGGVSYTWAPGATLSVTTGTPVMASPTVTTTYTVTGTDANGCVNTATRALTVNALPTIAAGSGATTVCFGSSTTLSATGGTTYSWSPSTGLATTTGTPVTVTPAATTTYTVTGTNANGCSNTATRTITVTRVAVSAASGAICSGSSTTLTASGATTYSWAPNTSISATTGANVVTTTTATRTYTVTGVQGTCTTTATTTVTVNALPAIGSSASPSASICIGGGTTVTATGGVSYTWAPSAGLSATTGVAIVCSPTTTTTYTITGTDANGCINTRSQVVTVNGLPSIAAGGGATSICNGSTTTLSASGGSTYSWSPATGLSATTGTPVTCSASVTTTYTVTGTSAAGCSATATRTITVGNINLVPGTASLCNGLSTTITASGGTTYSWSPSTGLSATTGATVTASPAATTTYTVTGITTGGCAGNITQTITVNSIPTITATSGVPAVCAGSSTTLSATGGATYSWSPSAGLSATTGSPVTATPSGTTIYTVTGTSAAGCSATATRAISVNVLPAVNTTSGSDAVCIGSSTTMSATGAATYTWLPATGLSATTGANVTATPAATTTYTVTGINGLGCINIAVRSVTVNSLPVIGIAPGATTICQGNTTSMTASGGISYVWLPGTGLNTTTGGSVITAATSNITYTVTGTDAAGCVNTAIQSVTVNALPSLSVASGPLQICTGSSTTFAVSGAASYSWLPATGLSAVTGGAVTASPTVSTTYSITGVSAEGCSVIVTRDVTVNALPVPTFVTEPGIAICTGSNTVYTTQAGQTDYIWTVSGTAGVDYTIVSGGTGSSSSSVTLQWLTTGVKSVLVNYTNAAGCMGLLPAGNTTTAGTVVSVAAITGNTILPADAVRAYASITPGGVWASSNTAVATVDAGGSVTAVDTGITTLSYSVTNSCGTAVATLNIHVMLRQWTGGTPGQETEWTNAENWIGGVVPDSTNDITIPAATEFYPVIPASSAVSVKSLTIQPGGMITIAATGSLAVKGQFESRGTVDGDGLIELSGAARQHIKGNGHVANIKMNNGAGVVIDPGAVLTVTTALTVARDTLVTSDSLVLSSDEVNTARVAELPAGSYVQGKVKGQQYIQAGYRRYRFFSHPFTSSVSLGQLQTYMDITGLGGATNGFTTTGSNSPSAYRFNTYTSNSSASSDPGWRAYTNITPSAADSNTLRRYQGMRILMRGAKGEGLNGETYSPSENTIAIKGEINQGRLVVTLAKGATTLQDNNLLGNPYPSAVDIGTILYNAKVAGNIVGAAFYVWNTSLGSAGQYQAVSIGEGAAIPYFLPANAAFQVRAAHNNDTLVFNEANKAPSGSAYLFRSVPNTTLVAVYDEQDRLYDELQLNLDEHSAATETNDDAIKLMNGDMDFYSLSADKVRLAIDVRKYNEQTAIPLGITTNFAQTYKLKVERAAMPAGGTLYLHDKLTNAYTEVVAGNTYTFSITKDKATQGNDRFELTGKPAVTALPAARLAVTMTPNPASGQVGLVFGSVTAAHTSVTITNMTGHKVYSQVHKVNAGETINVSLEQYASGTYLVEVVSGSETYSAKLIKE